MQDPLGSKKVSLVPALYIFSLALPLFFLIRPSFQSGTSYNLFGGKMHMPGNCLPHSVGSAYALYCTVYGAAACVFEFEHLEQSMFK